jgi:hypothetical protein
LIAASTTNVTDSTQSCIRTSPAGFRNCGRNATKNTIPFGLSAVTRYVFAKSRQREPGAGGAAGSAEDYAARNSLIPR